MCDFLSWFSAGLAHGTKLQNIVCVVNPVNYALSDVAWLTMVVLLVWRSYKQDSSVFMGICAIS